LAAGEAPEATEAIEMPRSRRWRADRSALLVLVTLFSALIAACSGSASSPILSTVGGPVDDSSYSGEAMPAASAAPAAAAGAPDGSTTGGGDAVGAVDDARIVRTGTMQLEVKDVPEAVSTARAAIRALGGYVGASNTSNDGDQPVAEITYRIPVARWEDALAALRGLNGQTTKVVTEQTQAVEVTGQVIDLDARIRNLRASETALQAIAAKATKVSDVLDVQAQLTNVRGQIEELTAQLTDLSNRADLATLTVTFGVPLVAVEVAQKGWDPTAVVDEASASMVGILQGLASAGIWFAIVWLPILIVLVVVGGVVVWFLRRMGIVGRDARPTPPAPPAPPATPPAPAAPMASEG
jgi:hypothetical protein